MARIKSARQTVQAVVNNSNPFVIDIPDHVAGDLIFVTMNHIATETTTLTPPGSWTEEFYDLTSNQIITYGWWLLASGSSETLTVNVTTGTSREWVALTVVVEGVDQTTPIDGSATAGGVGVPPAGGFDLFPSYSTSVDNCLVISTGQLRTNPTIDAFFPDDVATRVIPENPQNPAATGIYGCYRFQDTAGAVTNPKMQPMGSAANQRYMFTHVGIRSADTTLRPPRVVPSSWGELFTGPFSAQALFGVSGVGWPAGAATINGRSISSDTVASEGSSAYGALSDMPA